MENNKYFTPDIEDVYVGYELEWKCKIRNQDWEKTICDTDLISIIYDEYEHADFEEPYNEQFRVPYLTKEQIEAEGWKFDYNLGDFDYYIKKINDKEEYELEFCYKECININIWKRTLYHGECKDINTFRKLIKLLGI